MIFTVSLLIVLVNFMLLLTVSTIDSSSYHSYLPFMLFLFSFPHFIATYGVWISRVKSWRQEWWPLIFPFLYLGIFYACVRGQLGSIHPSLIVKLTYVYLLYHFCSQLYGVALWLGSEKKVEFSLWEKRLLRAIFLLMGAYTLMDLELRGATGVLFYTDTPITIFPAWIMRSTLILFFVLALGFCFISFKHFYQKKKLEYLLPLAILGTGFIWFIPPFSHGLVFYLPILHGLQYYPFIYMKMRKLKLWQWGLFLMLCVGIGEFFFRQIPFWDTGLGSMGMLWTAMILTLLNNHHFIIDGRIWKLSDPKNTDLFTSGPELQSLEVRARL